MAKRIVALSLLTREELQLLGPQLELAFPTDETPCFGKLLRAIDEADRELPQKLNAPMPLVT